MSNSTSIPTKVKITSLILGVIGVFWLVSCTRSLHLLQVHEILLSLGAGFTFIALALEPSILFHRVFLTVKSLRTIPQISPLSWALIAISLLCFLLSGIAYLIS